MASMDNFYFRLATWRRRRRSAPSRRCTVCTSTAEIRHDLHSTFPVRTQEGADCLMATLSLTPEVEEFATGSCYSEQRDLREDRCSPRCSPATGNKQTISRSINQPINQSINYDMRPDLCECSKQSSSYFFG